MLTALICSALMAPLPSVNLRIDQIAIVDAKGKPFSPSLGDDCYLRVDWTVTGEASKPYVVRFQIANVVHDWKPEKAVKAGKYSGYFGWPVPLDGVVPFRAELDPDNTLGEQNRDDNVAESSFRPTMPTQAFSYYGAQTLYSQHNVKIEFDGAAKWSQMTVLTGAPKSQTFQTVIEDKLGSGAQLVPTLPTSYPGAVLKVDRPKADDTFAIDQSIKTTALNARINPAMITDTWASFAKLPPDVAHFVRPEKVVQSGDPKIAAFVSSVLPGGFRSRVTPIEAARKLFLAVIANTSYITPSPFDALTVLTTKRGDCGGYTALYCASLRSIGIPARMVSGFTLGKDQWHCWAEVYMPSVGWIPQDPTYSDSLDPEGKYAYYFAVMPNLNSRVALGWGNTFDLPNTPHKADIFQTLYYWGLWSAQGKQTITANSEVSLTPFKS